MIDANISSTSTQVKVTLPHQLYQFVKQKAEHYGLSLSAYIKHLVIDEAKTLEEKLESMDLPTYKLSKDYEEFLEKGIEEHKQGKTVKAFEI